MRMSHHYKEIEGYPGYYVTVTGTIRNKYRKLKPSVHRDGHLYHVVIREGVQAKLFVHKAVMLTYGAYNHEEKPLIRHLDGDPTNNRLENLAWGTHKENAQDREFHKKLRLWSRS